MIRLSFLHNLCSYHLNERENFHLASILLTQCCWLSFQCHLLYSLSPPDLWCQSQKNICKVIPGRQMLQSHPVPHWVEKPISHSSPTSPSFNPGSTKTDIWKLSLENFSLSVLPNTSQGQMFSEGKGSKENYPVSETSEQRKFQGKALG